MQAKQAGFFFANKKRKREKKITSYSTKHYQAREERIQTLSKKKEPLNQRIYTEFEIELLNPNLFDGT